MKAGAIFLFVFVSVLGCSPPKDNIYSYYFCNGTVYIEETSGFNGKTRVYWHDGGGSVHIEDGNRAYGGLRFCLPAVYLKIPKDEAPFKWKPPKEFVMNSIEELLTDYEAAAEAFNAIGMDVSLRSGETKETAWQRLIAEAAQKYCSYSDQAKGYSYLVTNAWR